MQTIRLKLILYYLPSLLLAGVIIIIWHIIKYWVHLESYILPSFSEIFNAFYEERASLTFASKRTALYALGGFLISIIVGYALAVCFLFFNWIRVAIYPWILILQMLPFIVLAPIIVLWLGQGLISITFLTFIISLFPIVVNTTLGLTSVNINLINLFKMYNANRFQELMMLRFPYALPYFLTGLSISGTLAPLGAISSDLFAGVTVNGNGGLGYLILIYYSQMKTPALFATAITCCLIGLCFVISIKLLSWYLLCNWHISYIKNKFN